ncbi:hypothetical protein [Brumimicrobium oceani]|uniref:Uncharacterized protein n=1 Tax=Brumimicrobium oceani TaxID=2100725 RepID=A0A2U2X545_9FLAO|nr:hypothetical protein [Brumimicrobium oceani]PWH82908.1 hypothetical protein DIT68_13505 [Brumimicrobium oceani]
MKAIRSLISIFLIVGYIVGLTNNLMPRCESEYEHQQHIVSIHTNHFHGSDNSDPEIAHIGHEEHDDETSFVNILQHIFDDVDNPKEKCEFGFFANVHHQTVDVKSLAIITVLKYPEFFVPTFEDSKELIEYSTPDYTPPDRQSQQQRGPPNLLV